MLTEIVIKNLGILETVELVLGEGFNVLTGETGAGKSMIVQAVHLLLGARGSEELIRTGAEEAEVTARFWTPGREPWGQWLREQGIDFEGELLLRRLVSRSGRNRCYVNDQAVTLKFMAALGRELLSLSGQHEYQSFLAPDNHLNILDMYGGLTPREEEFQGLYKQWQGRQREWKNLTQSQARLEAERELLSFQVQELERAEIRPGEDEELAQSRERLQHASQLWEAAKGAYDEIYGSKAALLTRLAEVKKSLEIIARIEPGWSGRLAELGEAAILLEDLALTLRDYMGQVSADPQRLQEVEERLDVLSRMKRKYGPELSDVLAFLERGRAELARLENLEFEKEAVERQLRVLAGELGERAKGLSAARREAAVRLAAAVEEQLADLALPKARFGVHFKEAQEEGEPAPQVLTVGGQAITARGVDRVEFTLAPNPGEEAKPLARIASGGELSRVVLSLKNILAQEAGHDTSVFDEVDTGIGGGVAGVVGEKLQRLAGYTQIISITHWPQIACYADSHFRVEKAEQQGRTVTTVKRLSTEERLEELARMLGGVQVTATTLAQAQEFLEAARSSDSRAP